MEWGYATSLDTTRLTLHVEFTWFSSWPSLEQINCQKSIYRDVEVAIYLKRDCHYE